MPQLRLAPSGPPILGDNVGDVLIWDGDEWVPGPQAGGATAFRARSIGAQEDPLGALALLPDSVLQFSAGEWSAGQAIFVQSVLQIAGVNDGSLAFELWWSEDGVTWSQFYQPTPIDVSFSEGAAQFFPLQSETPAIPGGWTSVFVGAAAAATGILSVNVSVGHIQAQPFTPLPD